MKDAAESWPLARLAASSAGPVADHRWPGSGLGIDQRKGLARRSGGALKSSKISYLESIFELHGRCARGGAGRW